MPRTVELTITTNASDIPNNFKAEHSTAPTKSDPLLEQTYQSLLHSDISQPRQPTVQEQAYRFLAQAEAESLCCHFLPYAL